MCQQASGSSATGRRFRPHSSRRRRADFAEESEDFVTRGHFTLVLEGLHQGRDRGDADESEDHGDSFTHPVVLDLEGLDQGRDRGERRRADCRGGPGWHSNAEPDP